MSNVKDHFIRDYRYSYSNPRGPLFVSPNPNPNASISLAIIKRDIEKGDGARKKRHEVSRGSRHLTGSLSVSPHFHSPSISSSSSPFLIYLCSRAQILLLLLLPLLFPTPKPNIKPKRTPSHTRSQLFNSQSKQKYALLFQYPFNSLSTHDHHPTHHRHRHHHQPPRPSPVLPRRRTGKFRRRRSCSRPSP